MGMADYWLMCGALVVVLACGSRLSAQPAAPTTTTKPFVSAQPDIPYLPKPEPRPADWLVEHDPVNPNATTEARALLKFLYSISNKYTLVGQHNHPGRQRLFTDGVSAAFGKTPSLYGTDWGFAKAGDMDTAYERREVVRELIRQHRNGSIITICWHQVRPTEDEPVTFPRSVQGEVTDAEFADLLNPRKPLYKHWCAQVDVIAEYLKQLQDAGVPILWRPMHEINGDWFWWNGRRGPHGTITLYRQLYDRLTNFHKLNNLIWVWNPDRPSNPDRQFVDYFPGHDVVDVLSFDCYGDFEQSYYDELNALSDGKVMGISEVGNNLPMPEAYQAQPKWAYFMRWSFDVPRSPSTRRAASTRRSARRQGLTREMMAQMISDPRMLSLQDQQYWKVIAPFRAAAGLPASQPAE
jgi:mannan endo-1,4-beta-mannosidase